MSNPLVEIVLSLVFCLITLLLCCKSVRRFNSFLLRKKSQKRNQTFTNVLGFSFSWTIPGFSAAKLVELQSPPVPYHSGEWSLVLKSVRINESSKLGLYIKTYGLKTPLEIKYQFSVVDVKNERCCDFAGRGTLTPAQTEIGAPEFISVEDVNVQSGLLVNGSVTFLVEIVAVNAITENYVIPDFAHSAAPPSTEPTISGDQRTTTTESELQNLEDDLQRDLGGLLKTSELADLTFLSQGKNFSAHKAVVAARCSTLARRISDGVVKIEFDNIDPDVFSDVLTFIYTNKVSANSLKDKAELLIKAAEELQLEKLKAMAEDAILSSLNPMNAISRLVLAYECNCESLKEPILKIVKEHRKEVQAFPNWKSLVDHPEILLDLLNIE